MFPYSPSMFLLPLLLKVEDCARVMPNVEAGQLHGLTGRGTLATNPMHSANQQEDAAGQARAPTNALQRFQTAAQKVITLGTPPLLLTNFLGYILSWKSDKEENLKSLGIPIYMDKTTIKAYRFTISSLRTYLGRAIQAVQSEATRSLSTFLDEPSYRIGNGNTRMNRRQALHLLYFCMELLQDENLKRLGINPQRPDKSFVFIEDKPTNGWAALTWVAAFARSNSSTNRAFDLFIDLGSGGKFKAEPSPFRQGGVYLINQVQKIIGHGKFEFGNFKDEPDTKDLSVFHKLFELQFQASRVNAARKVWVGLTGGNYTHRQTRARKLTEWLSKVLIPDWVKARDGRADLAARQTVAKKIMSQWQIQAVQQQIEAFYEAKCSADFFNLGKGSSYSVFSMGGKSTQFSQIRNGKIEQAKGFEAGGILLQKEDGLDSYKRKFMEMVSDKAEIHSDSYNRNFIVDRV